MSEVVCGAVAGIAMRLGLQNGGVSSSLVRP